MRRLFLIFGVVAVLGALEAPALAQAPEKLNVCLYVDTVNGSRPAPGTKPRPVGCTQWTNWKRGEQIVFRVWGSVADTGVILNTENVKYAYVSVPGQPNLKLSWGPHGASDEPGLVLDGGLGRARGLPARLAQGPNRVQDGGEQVRALRLRHDHHPERGQENRFDGHIREIIYLGDHRRVVVDLGAGLEMTAKVAAGTVSGQDLSPGAAIGVEWRGAETQAFLPE